MPTPVQTLTHTSTGSNTDTISGTFAAGNTLIVVALATGVPTAGITSVATNHSETFTLVDSTSFNSSASRATGGYLLNCVGGSTTITLTGSVGAGTPSLTWIIREYATVDVNTFDLHAVANTNGTNPASGTTGTTNQASETIIGWIASLTITADTAGSGYANYSSVGQSATHVGIEDKSVTSTGTQQATFTNAGSVAYVAGVMTFPIGITAISTSDSGSGSDTVAVTAAITGTDSGSGSDTIAVTTAITGTDSGSGSDTVAVTTAITGTDSGSGSDTIAVTVANGVSDNGVGNDVVSINNAISISDSGTAIDNITANAAIGISDNGVGVDNVAVNGAINVDRFNLLPLVANDSTINVDRFNVIPIVSNANTLSVDRYNVLYIHDIRDLVENSALRHYRVGRR